MCMCTYAYTKTHTIYIYIDILTTLNLTCMFDVYIFTVNCIYTVYTIHLFINLLLYYIEK